MSTEAVPQFFSIATLISLLTLSVLEIVLGIDNIIFISIITRKLPKEKQRSGRTIGLILALIMRIAMLFSITWIVGLAEPLFHINEFGVTGKDIILFAGGIFLIYKATIEIHNKIEGYDDDVKVKSASFSGIVLQIVLIDMVFSFDSILAAVGIAGTNFKVMVIAVIIAMIIMIVFSGKVSDFINDNPTIKMLALSFLLMIGAVLLLDAFHQHVDKTFIYVAIAFSLLVETLNIRMKRKQEKRKRDSNDDERDIF